VNTSTANLKVAWLGGLVAFAILCALQVALPSEFSGFDLFFAEALSLLFMLLNFSLWKLFATALLLPAKSKARAQRFVGFIFLKFNLLVGFGFLVYFFRLKLLGILLGFLAALFGTTSAFLLEKFLKKDVAGD